MATNTIVESLIALRREDTAIYAHISRYYDANGSKYNLYGIRHHYGYAKIVLSHLDIAIIHGTLNNDVQCKMAVDAAYDILKHHELPEKHSGSIKLHGLFDGGIAELDKNI